MISLFGTTYGFLQPLFLITAPIAAALLVYAYLKRGQGARVPVASLLILKSLQKKSFSRKKFKPPLRFFIELFILLLLALGAANLFQDKSAKRIAVLIDNSFSMSARQSGALADETLLSSAKREAQAFINSLPSTSQISLYTSSPSLKVLNANPFNLSQATKSVEQIDFSYAGDVLNRSINKLYLNSNYDKLAIFTDKDIDQNLTESPERLRIYSLSKNTNISGFSNISIGNISLTRASLNSQSTNLEVLVNAFSEDEIAIDVILEKFEKENFFKLNAQSLKLQAKETKRITFNDIDPKLSYRVKIEASQAQDKLKNDHISYDNTAWISENTKQAEVLFIGSIAPHELGLDKISTIQFKHIDPNNYSKKIEALKEESVLVFHRFVPSSLPKSNSLFIFPGENNQIFPLQEIKQEVEITDWLESHPINNYLNLPSLKLKNLSIFEAPTWSKALISTTQGVAAFVGSYHQHKYAVLGFEILPYGGKNSPILSILTLNTLKWLSDLAMNSGSQTVYSGKETMKAKYYDSTNTGRLERLSAHERNSLPLPGLVGFEKEGTGIQYQAVNYFSDQESNLLEKDKINIPANITYKNDTSNSESLTKLIAWLVLALIVLDIILCRTRVA